MSRIVKVGIGQYSSVHMNLTASIKKLETILSEAADLGVKLLVVGRVGFTTRKAGSRERRESEQRNGAGAEIHGENGRRIGPA